MGGRNGGRYIRFVNAVIGCMSDHSISYTFVYSDKM